MIRSQGIEPVTGHPPDPPGGGDGVVPPLPPPPGQDGLHPGGLQGLQHLHVYLRSGGVSRTVSRPNGLQKSGHFWWR